LILGAVILATILIGFTNEKVDQAGEIDAATNSTIDGFIKDLTNPEDYEPISGVGSNCVLTLSSNPPAGGTVSGAGTFSCGTSVTASATALSGYTFNNWTTPTGSLSTNPYTFTLNSNTSLIANFSSTAPSTYTLNVSLSGGGNGTVTSNLLGINCGSDCSENYSSGTSVTLTANPVTGHSFGGWSGDGSCTGTSTTCTVSMTQARNVTATFNLPNTYTLNLTKTGGGTVISSPAGINCTESQTSCSATFPEGTNVVLDATIPSGSLSQMGGCDSSSGYPGGGDCIVLMNSNKNIILGFTTEEYTLNLIENPDLISISLTGSGTYSSGDTINISVNAINFVEGIFPINLIIWKDQNNNIVSNEVSFDYTMPSNDVNLTAYISTIESTLYNLKIFGYPNTNAFKILSGDGQYLPNTLVKIFALPNVNYVFKYWTLDGSIVSYSNEYKFTMPSEDTNLIAVFEYVPTSYNLILNKSPTTGGNVSGAGYYVSGSQVPVSATFNSGYSFKYWKDSTGVISSNPSFTYTIPSNNSTLTAYFAEVVHNLNVNVISSNAGEVIGEGSYEYNENVMLTAIPNEGYKFVNWTNTSGQVLSTNNNYSFNMPNNTYSLNANFELKTLPSIPYYDGFLYIHPKYSPENLSWFNSIQYCLNLDSEGYDDWYLIEKSQMDALWANGYGTLLSMNSSINKGDYSQANGTWDPFINNQHHWTSTESEPLCPSCGNSVYLITFYESDYVVARYPKYGTEKVRCVRN
jgi:hypothetical protein